MSRMDRESEDWLVTFQLAVKFQKNKWNARAGQGKEGRSIGHIEYFLKKT